MSETSAVTTTQFCCRRTKASNQNVTKKKKNVNLQRRTIRHLVGSRVIQVELEIFWKPKTSAWRSQMPLRRRVNFPKLKRLRRGARGDLSANPPGAQERRKTTASLRWMSQEQKSSVYWIISCRNRIRRSRHRASERRIFLRRSRLPKTFSPNKRQIHRKMQQLMTSSTGDWFLTIYTTSCRRLRLSITAHIICSGSSVGYVLMIVSVYFRL